VADKRTKGQEGEREAAKILKKNGYTILSTNFRSPFGEIDIIAENDGFLVFIEVKRLTGNSFGSSFDAIDKRKRMHIIRSAEMYIKMNRCVDRRVRFDVVGIDGDRIKLIKHAFTE